MRGKNFAYLWASGLFLLIAATDSLFALPVADLNGELADADFLPKCTSETVMPSSVTRNLEGTADEVIVLTPSKVLKNLVCSLSGN